MRLYLTIVIALIILYMYGPPTAQLITAILLAVGAIPAWLLGRREAEKAFWRKVESIVASPAPPSTAPASEMASGPQDSGADRR